MEEVENVDKYVDNFHVIRPRRRKLSEVQRLILAWKAIIEVDEGDRVWNRVWFKRGASSAKDLLDMFGFDGAVRLMEMVHDDMVEMGRAHTLETVVKLSDNYREKLK